MNYIICTTGRARSSVLMIYLKQLGAGYPDVWCNSWFNRQRDFYDLDELCKFIQSRKTDGHVGLRTTWSGIQAVCNTHNLKIKKFFDKALPNAKYIYFTRDNLRQTTETLFYEYTQMFDGTSNIIPGKDIEKSLVDFAIEESCWEIFFEKNNISPLHIKCEDLIVNKEKALRKVLDFLDIEYPNGISITDKSKDAMTNHEEVQRWYDTTMKRYLKVMGVQHAKT